MDDEAETYKLWRIRKTVMQVCFVFTSTLFADTKRNYSQFIHLGSFSSLTTVDTWSPKMNWIKLLSSSRNSSVTSQGKIWDVQTAANLI